MDDLSEFEEMYLKRIFEIYDSEPSTIVKTSQLAEIMSVSNASSTEMIQRLSDRGLLTYVPYKGCRLTPIGFNTAARIKRREGLLQILLTDVIGFDGDVDATACKMEHNISIELEESLDRMLGYPEQTPKGKKIPSIKRSVKPHHDGLLLPLSFLPIGSSATIEVIALQPTDVKTLELSGLGIGSRIEVREQGVYSNGQQITISESIMKRILSRTEDLNVN